MAFSGFLVRPPRYIARVKRGHWVTIVPTGPVKEKIVNEDNIDLTAIHAPIFHLSDGGRYINKFGMHVLKSPDGKWTNWSIARNFVNSEKTFTVPVAVPQYIEGMLELWKAERKVCPWALAFGAPPAGITPSSPPLPDGISEAGYVGALTGFRYHLWNAKPTTY